MYKTNLNRKTRKHQWTDDERRVIAKMAGKYPLSEITAEVNRVSKITRTNISVRSEAGSLGYKLGLVA